MCSHWTGPVALFHRKQNLPAPVPNVCWEEMFGIPRQVRVLGFGSFGLGEILDVPHSRKTDGAPSIQRDSVSLQRQSS